MDEPPSPSTSPTLLVVVAVVPIFAALILQAIYILSILTPRTAHIPGPKTSRRDAKVPLLLQLN